jgi:acyl-CoA synthetase (AMP-forming)/AMP-acid ligase II
MEGGTPCERTSWSAPRRSRRIADPDRVRSIIAVPIRTLTDALELVADRRASGYSYLTEDDGTRFESFEELYRRASRIGLALQARGVEKGDRIGLILPDSQDFIDSFFGAIMAGAVPVPIAPPAHFGRAEAYLDAIAPLVAKVRPRMLLADGRLRILLGGAPGNFPPPPVESLDLLLEAVDADGRAAPVAIDPEDTVLIQFTSGSTLRPRGVKLSHANLVANLAAMSGPHGLQSRGDDYGVSWLPLHHDMGLIGKVLVPMYAGMRGTLFISPDLFLKRPTSWLRQISSQRGTITFAPNFAYRLCVSRLDRRAMEGIDLSSIRVAGCGAEPIHHGVLSDFARMLEPYGFRREALTPCYGLAEHALAVTFSPVDEGMITDRVWVDALARGEAARVDEREESTPATHGAGTGSGVIDMVSCGRIFPAHQLKIIAPDGTALPERRVGEIVVRGPSVMQGYFEDDEETGVALRAGWLHTGDLGYVVAGHLYVCGRSKDLIIIRGRNYYPQDIEWHASHVAGVRQGNVVAFGVADPGVGRERVVIAAEVKSLGTRHAQLTESIRARVLEGLALAADHVLLLPPHTLPKTSSGKLQRARTRELYRSGRLGKSTDHAAEESPSA